MDNALLSGRPDEVDSDQIEMLTEKDHEGPCWVQKPLSAPRPRL